MGDKLPEMNNKANKKPLRSVGACAVVLAVGLLAGCGQKGPLTLPKDSAKPPAGTASTPAKP
jgi:predicted small lipoprotein YifL